MMARNRRSNRDRQDVGAHPPISSQADSLTADPAPAAELDLDYRGREQFLGFHARGERFACIVTHRRAGKTVACIQALQRAALTCARERPRFAYLSPFLKQSKTVAWDYLRGASAPLIEMGARVRESELRVDYPNGGQVRLYGADNPDALRGIYLDGVVLDEYADMDARVWAEIIRPALADRAGWAVFIGTPKGRNAFFALWRRAQSEANWFSLMLKASDTGLILADELELARRDLTEEQYAQEFECSFEAAVAGAYYGKLMARAEEERRVARAPHDPAAPVWTSWDLGMRDATAIWFAQAIGREIRINRPPPNGIRLRCCGPRRIPPLVFVTTIDPVGGGWVESLSRPGTNATGFASFEFSMSGRWLELLKEIAPGVKRVAVIRDPLVPAGSGGLAAIQTVAPSLGVELTPIGVRDAGEIEHAIAAFARGSNGGLILVGPTSSVQRHRDLIVALAARHRLPAVYANRLFVTGGGLISYAPDSFEQYRRAAGYVDRILKGEKPADLPVQAPTKFELVVNLKTAKALGLDVPQTLLARANEVIE
jgi:ABC transporter substrate binding protein